MSDYLSQTVGDYVDKLTGVDNQVALEQFFAKTIDDLGFKYFTYHIVKVVGMGTHLPLVSTTYPEQWVKRYFEQNYMQLDPVLAASFVRSLPYVWNEVALPDEMDKHQKNFFMEADDFKLRDGLSIPINGYGGEVALMSVVADGNAKEARETINQHRHTLHLLTMYHHNHASSMLIDSALKDYKPTLTKREKEVLTWVGSGKTTWETSEILSIAETTVLSHIENAKRKLEAPSRTQAVVKAIYLGLIQI